MKNNNKYCYYCIAFAALLSQISEGQIRYSDKTFREDIKTIQVYRDGWNLSYPVIRLNSDDKLVLSFDLLGSNPEYFHYTVVHCDKDWNASGIFPSDYLTGFTEDEIENYRPSFNTKVNYFNYRIAIPNDRIGMKISGNYIIKVFPPGQTDSPVLTARFMVTEERAGIIAVTRRPSQGEFFNAGQQVEISVNISKIASRDPANEFFTFILRNGSFNDAKENLKPEMVAGNEVRYTSLSGSNIFYAGNEYRYFDIRSIKYTKEFIRKIEYMGGRYHFFLLPSENREFKPYFYWKDFNGKYYVAIQDGRDMDTEADYVHVYFTMPSANEIPGGKLYISGAFNNWNFTPENRMIYNPGRGQYEGSLLLKQGYYNYEYLFLKDGTKGASPSFFEGNHYETENDYLILVYYRNNRERYDRLVGSVVINSTRSPGY